MSFSLYSRSYGTGSHSTVGESRPAHFPSLISGALTSSLTDEKKAWASTAASYDPVLWPLHESDQCALSQSSLIGGLRRTLEPARSSFGKGHSWFLPSTGALLCPRWRGVLRGNSSHRYKRVLGV